MPKSAKEKRERLRFGAKFEEKLDYALRELYYEGTDELGMECVRKWKERIKRLIFEELYGDAAHERLSEPAEADKAPWD